MTSVIQMIDLADYENGTHYERDRKRRQGRLATTSRMSDMADEAFGYVPKD